MKTGINNLRRALHVTQGWPDYSVGGRAVATERDNYLVKMHVKTCILTEKGFKCAFSLIELMIAVAVFGMTIGAAVGVYIMCQKLWHATSLSMATSRDGNMALSRLVYGVGTNCGLRVASSVSINTNYHGVTNYYGVAGYPPKPGDATHYLTNGLPYDGSWRLTCINPYDGTNWIDFNKKASNIVYWMDTAPVDLSSRQLICNYVSAAFVSNNASGVAIQLTILRQEGWFVSTNQIGTFVLMRNRL